MHTKLILAMLAVTASLSACAGADGPSDKDLAEYSYGRTIMDDSSRAAILKDGATRRDVEKVVGTPRSTMPMPNGVGVCNEYMRRIGGRDTPLFVAYRNSDGRVLNFRYNTSCAEAQREGLLNRTDPIKPR